MVPPRPATHATSPTCPVPSGSRHSRSDSSQAAHATGRFALCQGCDEPHESCPRNVVGASRWNACVAACRPNRRGARYRGRMRLTTSQRKAVPKTPAVRYRSAATPVGRCRARPGRVRPLRGPVVRRVAPFLGGIVARLGSEADGQEPVAQRGRRRVFLPGQGQSSSAMVGVHPPLRRTRDHLHAWQSTPRGVRRAVAPVRDATGRRPPPLRHPPRSTTASRHRGPPSKRLTAQPLRGTRPTVTPSGCGRCPSPPAVPRAPARQT